MTRSGAPPCRPAEAGAQNALFLLAFLAALAFLSSALLLKRAVLRGNENTRARILDRNGQILRVTSGTEQVLALWTELGDFSPALVEATLAAEDKRFFYHPGVDPLAVARAATQLARRGRIISGGSTITQQLIHVALHHRRSLAVKILEMGQAVLLETVTSKRTILCHYLNRAPYGNQCFGAQAAAHLYFNKAASQLSLAEAALIAGLPAAPDRLNPYRHADRAIERQRAVLRQLAKATRGADRVAKAWNAPLSFAPRATAFAAPHFCDWVAAQDGSTPSKDRRTTLDGALQQDLERLTKTYVKHLKRERVSNGAIVVIDNHTMDLLAMVGSADFFDASIEGQVNGAVAPRTPGSTWKPFTYALAFEQGLPASTVIPDLPLHASTLSGDFSPRNFDESFHGPVRLRTALACSYNIPAVEVEQRVGLQNLYERLRQLGFSRLTEPADTYGLGLTLGGADATLLQLTRAYTVFPNDGRLRALRVFSNDPAGPEESVFSPPVAALVSDILSDHDARAAAFGPSSVLNLPFACAAKTGTSKNFRDSFTIGYTADYTVGVWVGNFDGQPMKQVAGSIGAGPLFREVMLRLHRNKIPAPFREPQSLVSLDICPLSGERPSRACPSTVREKFIPGTEPRGLCRAHRLVPIDIRNGLVATPGCSDVQVRTEVFEILGPIYRTWMDEHRMNVLPDKTSPLCAHDSGPAEKSARRLEVAASNGASLSVLFPDNGDVFVIDPVLRREYQTITLKPSVPTGAESVEWIVNGKTEGAVSAPFTARWTLVPGVHRIRVRARIGDAWKESGAVKIRVLPAGKA